MRQNPGGGDSHVKKTKSRGGLPYKKDGGVLVGNFEKKTLRGTKILFCRRGLKCFSPLRGTNTKTTHYLLSNFFSAQYPKRYRKSSL